MVLMTLTLQKTGFTLPIKNYVAIMQMLQKWLWVWKLKVDVISTSKNYITLYYFSVQFK